MIIIFYTQFPPTSDGVSSYIKRRPILHQTAADPTLNAVRGHINRNAFISNTLEERGHYSE